MPLYENDMICYGNTPIEGRQENVTFSSLQNNSSMHQFSVRGFFTGRTHSNGGIEDVVQAFEGIFTMEKGILDAVQCSGVFGYSNHVTPVV